MPLTMVSPVVRPRAGPCSVKKSVTGHTCCVKAAYAVRSFEQPVLRVVHQKSHCYVVSAPMR